METTNKTSLYLGLLIPVIAVLIVAGIVFIPRLGNKPQTDFLYSMLTQQPYYSNGYDNVNNCYWPVVNYSVKDGKLIKTPNKGVSYYETSTIKLCSNIPKSSLKPSNISADVEYDIYRYNPAEEKSTKLTFNEASALTLDPSPESADGYMIKNQNSGGFFFSDIFGGRNYNQKYLYGHNTSFPIKINSANTSPYSYDQYYSFTFIGWVK